jgi:hypothetical protein
MQPEAGTKPEMICRSPYLIELTIKLCETLVLRYYSASVLDLQ